MSKYGINMKLFTLDKLKIHLKEMDLIPSQRILKEKIDEKFNMIKSKGILNLDELKLNLKDKSNLKDFSEETNIPEDYLIILRREINSYKLKTRKLRDFFTINKDVIEKLEMINIKDTIKLFDKVFNKEDRISLSKELDVDLEIITYITRLADVTRLRYVNHTFATLLIESEYSSVEVIAKSDYKKLYSDIKNYNDENNIFKGAIGMNDMKYLINDAKYNYRNYIVY